MGRKLEEKILEALKQKVFEKDRELQNKEDKSGLINSTKEALAELTSLSRKEVDKLEREVRQQEEAKREKARKILIKSTIGLVAILVIGGIFLLIESSKVHIRETFDDNARNWLTFEEIAHHRSIENGAYLLSTQLDGWCYWDKVSLDLPETYTVELATTWKRGRYTEYGLTLMASEERYRNFSMFSDGYAKSNTFYVDHYVDNEDRKNAVMKRGNGKNQNIQRIEVRGQSYEYFINDQSFDRGTFSYLDRIQFVGLRVCEVQVVAFDYLKVTDDATGKTIFFDDFENERYVNDNFGWSPERVIKKEGKIENGQYLLTANVSADCYHSTIDQPISGDFEMILTSTWQTGQTDPYGLLLMKNSDIYLSFEVNNNGDARLVHYGKEKAEEVPYANTQHFSDSATSITQKVVSQDGLVQYYVNDQLIDSKRTKVEIEKIGIQVCGKQTVAFDELEIIEK